MGSYNYCKERYYKNSQKDMTTNRVLSICIPTYNRANYLDNCLSSIKIQLSDNPVLNNFIEVVVSDNNSTDNTKDIIEKYKNYFINFKYLTNESNIGFDLNVLNVIKNANGKYCWYLGDDDTIINGGIEFIYNLLKDDNYDFIGVEATPHLLNDNKEKEKFINESVVEIKDFNSCYFDGYCQGGFSVLIFNRELWLKCLDIKNYLEHWLYYETVLKILALTKKNMLYVKQPVVVTGQDCRWSENGTELFTFINANILTEKMISFGFDKKMITNYITQNSKRIIIILLRAKGHGLKCDLKTLKFIYKNSKISGYFRLFLATMIYFIPNQIIIIIRDLKKYITNKTI